MSTRNYSVYTYPGIDARVAIATKGTACTLAFLAKGRSRKADGTYVKRNPERSALIKALVGYCLFDGWGRILRASKGGKADSPIEAIDLPFGWTDPEGRTTADRIRSAHSKAGNYRFDLALATFIPKSPNEVAEALGLVPCEGARAPKDVRWLR